MYYYFFLMVYYFFKICNFKKYKYILLIKYILNWEYVMSCIVKFIDLDFNLMIFRKEILYRILFMGFVNGIF